MDDQSERELSGPQNDGNAKDFTSNKERSERLRGSWNTPITVLVNGHAELIVALPRRVSALDPYTGERLWTCGDGAPLAYASLMEENGVVVALGGYSGTTTVFRPDREALKRVATNELNEASNASVVVAGSDVLVRTDQALWCFANSEQN